MNQIKETEINILIQDPNTRREAFKLIVSAYSQPLYWQIRRLVLSHEDANDILQDTFIKAWENLDCFRGDAKISTWIYRIAINESLNFLNKQKDKYKITLDDPESQVLKQLEEDPYFDGNEIEKKFQQAVHNLPEKQRIIFNLKYYQELKYEDISQIMGTSIGALKASYHHAVKKIKNFFEDND